MPRMFGIVPRPTVRSISCARPATLWIPIPGPVVCQWGVDKTLVTISIIQSTLVIQWFPMLILIQLLSNGYPMVYEWLVKGFQWLSNGLPMVFQFSNGYPMDLPQYPWVPMGSHGFPLVASSASHCQAVHCALVQQVLLGARASGQRVHCTRSLNLVSHFT